MVVWVPLAAAMVNVVAAVVALTLTSKFAAEVVFAKMSCSGYYGVFSCHYDDCYYEWMSNFVCYGGL